MSKNFYPPMIVLLLGAFICFLIWSGFQASTQGTRVTDRDYYSKGLKYNSTKIEKQAAVSMGWTISPQLEQRILTVKLADGKHVPVSKANAMLFIYSRPDSDQLKIKMTEQSTGSYTAKLPAHLTGELTVRIELEREGARLNRQLLLNVK